MNFNVTKEQDKLLKHWKRNDILQYHDGSISVQFSYLCAWSRLQSKSSIKTITWTIKAKISIPNKIRILKGLMTHIAFILIMDQMDP